MDEGVLLYSARIFVLSQCCCSAGDCSMHEYESEEQMCVCVCCMLVCMREELTAATIEVKAGVAMGAIMVVRSCRTEGRLTIL